MKGEINGKQTTSTNKEDLKKMRQGLAGPPQLTLDPERRRDFFNRLLEKYSAKSTKINNPPSGASYGPRSARFPSVPPTKVPTKIKDKFLRKKKSSSERSIVRSSTIDDFSGLDPLETWKSSVKNHLFDTSVYKNHVRISTRFPYPMPIIEELVEPLHSSEGSDSEESKSGDTASFDSITHSFTLLPCGVPKHGSNENIQVHYEEKVVEGKIALPEELQPRHVAKTSSGTLLWVGNDIIHKLVQKKNNKKSVAGNSAEKESKLLRDLRLEDVKSSGEGEERPPSKKEGKIRKTKLKKNSSAQELDENSKVSKPLSSQDTKNSVKPSSSSLPHLGQEDGKPAKKFNEKVKKPKKLTKKQTFTLVTSKPPL